MNRAPPLPLPPNFGSQQTQQQVPQYSLNPPPLPPLHLRQRLPSTTAASRSNTLNFLPPPPLPQQSLPPQWQPFKPTAAPAVAPSPAPPGLSVTAQLDMVPLIKSPSFRVPPPVELPADIHPLPEDVTAYFVYPHTLETHALTQLPTLLQTLQSQHSQRLHLLASLAESKERARKARLNQLAPGWGGGGAAVLEPVRKDSVMMGSSPPSLRTDVRKAAAGPSLLEEDEEEGENLLGSPNEMGAMTLDKLERQQMEDLVQGLAAMDSTTSRPTSSARHGDLDDLFS